MAKIDKNLLSDDDKKLTNEQTYDSALASIVTKLTPYVIPLINEIFGEKFSPNAEVALRNNKHVLQRTDTSLDRRDSDIVVELTEMFGELVKKSYTFECETWYNQAIVFRIAEYGSSVAIETAHMTEDGVVLKLPNSSVIFLRPNANIPKELKITYEAPNGEKMSYDVPTLQIKDYSIDELFDKKLLILLPFYLFKFVDEFDEMEGDAKRRIALNTALRDINQRLEALTSENSIDSYQKVLIQTLLKRVSNRLVAQYENLKKEVDEIMTGAIMRTPADEILEQGIELGMNNTMALITFLLNAGRTEEVQKASIDPGFLKKLMTDFENGNLQVKNG